MSRATASGVTLLLPCALLLALAAPPSQAAAPQQRLAVLEFELAPGVKIDRIVFSDLARGTINRRVPSLFVMTRESTVALLEANGKTLADCEGQCEVEVGRKLGADFIIAGRIAQVGSTLFLSLRLFSTADGRLQTSSEARGKSGDELIDKFDLALEQLVASLGGAPLPAAPAPTQPAQPKAAPTEGNGAAVLDSLMIRKRPTAKESVASAIAEQRREAGDSHSIYDALTFRKPGTRVVEPKGSVELVALAGGVLTYGQFPGQRVEAFSLARTETTVASYSRCVNAGGCTAPRSGGLCNWDSGRSDHPVNCVDWQQANAFCAWIGGRLPTTAEFAHAAGGGEMRLFPWGKDDPGARACWAGPDTAAPKDAPGTCKVGAFPAGDSKQGLADLSGNVAEWTSTGGDEGGKAVHGGGRSDYLSASLLSVMSLERPAAAAREFVGFRCAQ